MHAAVIESNGGPEVFELRSRPDPECAADGIVIAVEAIGIESADLIARATRPLKTTPHVIGALAAGTVLEVGAAVADRQVGERVVTLASDGAYATRRAVRAAASWVIPDGLDLREAVCVPVAFGTAFEALFTAADLQAGETVLIHAGSGGIGIAAIQLAKLAGAIVIATASSATKLERLAPFGLDHGIDYAQQDVAKAVRKLLGDDDARGLDVVLDTVGGAMLVQTLGVLGWRGRLVSIGNASGVGAALDAAALWPLNATLHGVRLASVLRREPARAHAMIGECLANVASGTLRVPIAKVFDLAEAGAAHAWIEARQAFGRVLLVPG